MRARSGFAGLAMLAMAAAGAGAARAADPAQETAVLDKAQVTLTLHPFLTEDELAVLRLVLTNADALAIFVPKAGGFAALAASPDDGVFRDGSPVASAVAMAELPDAAAAEAAALAECEARKAGSAACVIVLSVAPAE